MSAVILIKRAYEAPSDDDGVRILVDRLWPRGLGKEKARVDVWMRDIAPSTALRRWYAHDPSKWDEFQRRYGEELDAAPNEVAELRRHTESGTVTFLYSSKETRYNTAVALKAYLESSS